MARRFQVTFDVASPATTAAFWAEALGYELTLGTPEEWDEGGWIVDPDGVGPTIFFQRVPEGKVVKNRLHLDLDLTKGRAVPVDVRREQVGAEADRLVALGGTRLGEHEEDGHYHVVMGDPEGNEFCLR
jgi:catechol 2,3-dioxygenase-like lactoylglutathione lyase family enzyme